MFASGNYISLVQSVTISTKDFVFNNKKYDFCTAAKANLLLRKQPKT